MSAAFSAVLGLVVGAALAALHLEWLRRGLDLARSKGSRSFILGAGLRVLTVATALILPLCLGPLALSFSLVGFVAHRHRRLRREVCSLGA